MTTPDVPHHFELVLQVPGTPEEVWEAIASAEGISSWMVPAELEPREGGSVTFHMGPAEHETSRGRVTAFEPARRFAYEEDWAALYGRPDADVTPLVTEFLVEAASGGTCTVRVVTSAFGTGAAWEDEFWDDMGTGWAPMLDNLRLYLLHFPGQRATPVWAGASFPAGPEAAITAVRAALGAGEPGDPVQGRGVTGRVERSVDRQFLVRIDEPVPGFLSFYGFGGEEGSTVHLQGYLFSDRAPSYAAQEGPAWQAWLEATAAAAAPAEVAPR